MLAPTVSHFVAGENRLGFGLFTTSRAQIADASAAVYIAPVGGGEARGPFVAHYESLEVKPQFLSETSASDPDAAKTLYVADVPFDEPGRLRGARDGAPRRPAGGGDLGRAAARGAAEEAGSRSRARRQAAGDPHPDRGRRRRRPRLDRHARPARRGACTRSTSRTRSARSRSCWCSRRRCCARAGSADRWWTSPYQVQAEYGDQADFIHMEIYNDNEVAKGFRPAGRRVQAALRAVGIHDRQATARSPRASRAPSASTS